MGEGGQLKIINASKYHLKLEPIHSYQMNAWEKDFSQTISPGKTASIYIEWDDTFGKNKDDDGGEAQCNFVGTDFTFEIQARTEGGRHLRVYWKKTVHDLNFYSQPYPLEGVSKLGWLHNGIVPLTFCELARGVAAEHLPTPINGLTYLARWMELYGHLIGHLPLNKLTLVCTHDSGSYDMIMCVEPYAKCQDLDIYGQLRQGVRVLDIRVGYDSNASGDERFILVHEMIKTNTTLKNAIEQVKRFLNENKNEVIILDFHRFTESVSVKGIEDIPKILDLLRKRECEPAKCDIKELQNVVKNYIGTDLLYPYDGKIPTLKEIWNTSQRVIVAWNFNEIPLFFFPSIQQVWPDQTETSGLHSEISKAMEKSHENCLWSICAILSQIPKPIQCLSPDVENWFQSGCDWALKSNIIALDFVEKTLIVQHAISECMLKGVQSLPGK